VTPALVLKARETARRGRTNDYTDRRLLADLRRLYARHGRLTFRIIKDAPNVASPGTYQVRFGTLTEAYRRIGYDKTKWGAPRAKVVTLSDEELLTGLKTCHDVLGFVNKGLIDKDRAIPSSAYYRRRFGSLSAAYKLAGLPDSDWRKRQREGFERHKASALAQPATAMLTLDL